MLRAGERRERREHAVVTSLIFVYKVYNRGPARVRVSMGVPWRGKGSRYARLLTGCLFKTLGIYAGAKEFNLIQNVMLVCRPEGDSS